MCTGTTLRLVVLHEAEQPAGPEVVDHLDLRQQRDAVAGAGGTSHRPALSLAMKAPDHPHGDRRAVRAEEAPQLRIGCRVVDQAVVRRQVRRRRWRAMALEIDWRGHHRAAQISDPPRHQRDVGDLAGPERQVEPLLHHVVNWSRTPVRSEGPVARHQHRQTRRQKQAARHRYPTRTSPARRTCSAAPATPPSPRRSPAGGGHAPAAPAPSSVRLSRRVVRWNKRTSKCCSSCATRRVTADWLAWVSRATAENEPVSVTRTKARSAAIKSTIPSLYAKMNSRKAGLFFPGKRSISCYRKTDNTLTYPQANRSQPWPGRQRDQPRRETMKTIMLAAAAVLALGVGSAFAKRGRCRLPIPGSPNCRA